MGPPERRPAAKIGCPTSLKTGILKSSPQMNKLLALNRSEIAIRILRAANELGLRTVAVYSQEDRRALQPRSQDPVLVSHTPRARQCKDQLRSRAARRSGGLGGCRKPERRRGSVAAGSGVPAGWYSHEFFRSARAGAGQRQLRGGRQDVIWQDPFRLPDDHLRRHQRRFAERQHRRRRLSHASHQQQRKHRDSEKRQGLAHHAGLSRRTTKPILRDRPVSRCGEERWILAGLACDFFWWCASFTPERYPSPAPAATPAPRCRPLPPRAPPAMSGTPPPPRPPTQQRRPASRSIRTSRWPPRLRARPPTAPRTIPASSGRLRPCAPARARDPSTAC